MGMVKHVGFHIHEGKNFFYININKCVIINIHPIFQSQCVQSIE